MKWIRVWFDGGDQTFVSGSEATVRTLEVGMRTGVKALKLTNPCGGTIWLNCEKVSCWSLQDASSMRAMAKWLEPLADLGDELFPDDEDEWGPGA